MSGRMRRVDLASGPVVIFAGSRGCTLETLTLVTLIRDNRELSDLIDALMDLREQLLEEPTHA